MAFMQRALGMIYPDQCVLCSEFADDQGALVGETCLFKPDIAAIFAVTPMVRQTAATSALRWNGLGKRAVRHWHIAMPVACCIGPHARGPK